MKDEPAKYYTDSMPDLSGIVKVTDSHLSGWGSTPGKSCSFYPCALCVLSDQHVKYLMPLGFP